MGLGCFLSFSFLPFLFFLFCLLALSLLFPLLLGPIEKEKEQERASQRERPAGRASCGPALRSGESCAGASRPSGAAGWIALLIIWAQQPAGGLRRVLREGAAPGARPETGGPVPQLPENWASTSARSREGVCEGCLCEAASNPLHNCQFSLHPHRTCKSPFTLHSL